MWSWPRRRYSALTSVISYSPRADGCQVGGDLDHLMVVEVEAGDGVVAPRPDGLLLDAQHLALGIDLGDSVALGVADLVAEHRGAGAPSTFARCNWSTRPWPKKMLSPSTSALGPPATKSAPMTKAWASPFGSFCTAYSMLDPPLAAVAQQGLEPCLLMGGGDDEHLADARQHRAW